MFALRVLVLGLNVVTLIKVGATGSGPANTRKSLCPRGWDYVPYARSCYQLLRGPKSWNDAASTCAQLGATLVTILDFHVDDALQPPAVCKIRPDGGPHDASTAKPVSIGNGANPNVACKDSSPYQCGALKAIMSNDAQYAKYVGENCAATCGLCLSRWRRSRQIVE